jgi:hypothetical protein
MGAFVGAYNKGRFLFLYQAWRRPLFERFQEAGGRPRANFFWSTLSFQIGETQDGRVAAARLVEVDVRQEHDEACRISP